MPCSCLKWYWHFSACILTRSFKAGSLTSTPSIFVGPVRGVQIGMLTYPCKQKEQSQKGHKKDSLNQSLAFLSPSAWWGKAGTAAFEAAQTCHAKLKPHVLQGKKISACSRTLALSNLSSSVSSGSTCAKDCDQKLGQQVKIFSPT